MTLRQKQSLFARQLGELIVWIADSGWEITLADGSIDTPRRYRLPSGRAREAEDAHHMRGSLHYLRLAQDLNLFVGGRWVPNGDHQVWKRIGTRWEAMHRLCRWGGRFGDANHFSIEHGGRA